MREIHKSVGVLSNIDQHQLHLILHFFAAAIVPWRWGRQIFPSNRSRQHSNELGLFFVGLRSALFSHCFVWLWWKRLPSPPHSPSTTKNLMSIKRSKCASPFQPKLIFFTSAEAFQFLMATKLRLEKKGTHAYGKSNLCLIRCILPDTPIPASAFENATHSLVFALNFWHFLYFYKIIRISKWWSNSKLPVLNFAL